MLKVLVLAVSVGLLSPASAADSKNTDAIARLLEITNAKEIVDSILVQTEQMMANMGAQLGVQPEEQKYFDEFSKKAFTLMESEMSWQNLQAEFSNLYAANFTEKEISDMIAFYETDTGRSMVDKMPKVLQESLQISQGVMVSVMPRIQDLARELQAELEQVRNSK